jgi:hypothetical protein
MKNLISSTNKTLVQSRNLLSIQPYKPYFWVNQIKKLGSLMVALFINVKPFEASLKSTSGLLQLCI